MKRKIMNVLGLLFLAGGLAFSQAETSDSLMVYGNCGMCKSRIEKAAGSVEGVSAAKWNKDTRVLHVVLVAGKTDVGKVHKAVAAVGHDTDMQRADDSVYNALPACCRYERKKEN